ncbi:MAG: undecaprenyl-diphosphate phosphatase [Exilispira sp.]
MIVSIIKSLIYGIIEGLTEFLPISSTGHLILLDWYLKISLDKGFTDIFEVFIQSGAILAVILIYFKKLWIFEKNFKLNKEKTNLWIYIFIACIPAIISGFLFKNIIQEKLFNPLTVCITLFIYGILIILIEKLKFIHIRENNERITENLAQLNWSKALLIGLFQVLAMIPGTSRSAATIIGGLIAGLSRKDAAEFSFFLAIPTIIGASLYSIFDAKIFLTKEYITLLMTGFFASFIVAVFVIKIFIKYLQKNNFVIFGIYRIAISIIFLIIYIL